MEEVLIILKTMRDRDYSDKKFTAALQGVDLETEEEDNDITVLKGTVAKDAGFGIGFGLGYVEEIGGN